MKTEKASLDSLLPGAIVRIVWKDHYSSSASVFPAPEVMKVESFGRVKEVNEEGVALFQSRVINYETFSTLTENMDGLFILLPVIVEVEKF